MEFRDCFIGKIDYLQYFLVQSIVDKANARINGADLHRVNFNIWFWEYYFLKAIFNERS